VGGDANQGKQPGKGDIRQGKIAAVDLDKLTVTIKADGKDIEAIATEDTKFFNVKGNDLKERLQAFKVGVDVNFRIRSKDNKNYLDGLAALGAGGDKGGKKGQPFVKVDSSKLVPLNELGDKEYKDGFKGGF